MPGVVAGVAVAFALATWLSDASVMHTLVVQSASKLGPDYSGQMPLIVTALLGAGLGGALSRWLATVVD